MTTLTKRWLGTVLAAVSTALGRSADPRDYDGMCTVTSPGHEPLLVPCRVKDLPEAGYWNRFSVTLEGAWPYLTLSRSATWVRDEATLNGNLLHTAIVGPNFSVLPNHMALRDRYRQAARNVAPFETLPQNVTVTVEGDKTVILLDQRLEDSDALAIPSTRWLERFRDALVRQGGVKPQVERLP